MPGYDSERFVNLSQNDKAELTCSICQDILCNPLVAQCCQQSFCEDCIKDWLKNNNICPYDRKTLTSSGLSSPPRIMLYMLGKLKINCNYKENGCNEVLLLENLSQHIINCQHIINRYNVEECEKCLCEIQDKSSHDCIKTLLELKRKANQELEILKRSSSAKLVSPNHSPIIQRSELLPQNSLRDQSLLREIRELRAEKENFLKIIQELSNNTKQKKSSNTSSFRISELEIIKQARRDILSPQIILNHMNEDMKNKVLLIVNEEFVNEFMSGSLFCRNIKFKLEDEFGSIWHCIASHQQNFESYYCHEEGYFIEIKYAELYLIIFKNKYFSFHEFLSRISDGKIEREIQILKTDMNENIISDVKEITFEAIENSDSLDEISNYLTEQMSEKYPGIWQCFLYAHFGSYQIVKIPETFIDFNVDNLNFILFKTEIKK